MFDVEALSNSRSLVQAAVTQGIVAGRIPSDKLSSKFVPEQSPKKKPSKASAAKSKASKDSWLATAHAVQEGDANWLRNQGVPFEASWQDVALQLQSAARRGTSALHSALDRGIALENVWESRDVSQLADLQRTAMADAARILRLSLSNATMQATLQLLRQHRVFCGLNLTALTDHRWEEVDLRVSEPLTVSTKAVGPDASLLRIHANSPVLYKGSDARRETDGCHVEHNAVTTTARMLELASFEEADQRKNFGVQEAVQAVQDHSTHVPLSASDTANFEASISTGLSSPGLSVRDEGLMLVKVDDPLSPSDAQSLVDQTLASLASPISICSPSGVPFMSELALLPDPNGDSKPNSTRDRFSPLAATRPGSFDYSRLQPDRDGFAPPFSFDSASLGANRGCIGNYDSSSPTTYSV